MSAGRGEETTVQGGVEGAEKQETPTVKFREAPLSPDPPSRRLWRTHVSRAPHGPNSAGGYVLGLAGAPDQGRSETRHGHFRRRRIRSMASWSRWSETVREIRTYPSPRAPYPVPGATTTAASSRSSAANSFEVRPWGTDSHT